MKYIGTILISGLLFSATTLPAQPKEQVMTLDEMYALADANSKTIKIFETALAGAEQDVSVARNAYLPNVDVSASASYNGNVWVADRDFSNGQNFTAPHFGNEFSVEASQVVFAGGAIHNNIKVLEIQKQISEWNLAEQRQQVYFLLAGYYLDLYKYRNLLVVYDRNMEQTMEVIGNMRAREAAGVALDNDITRYDVQYQNLSYKRTELISSIAIYNDKLVNNARPAPADRDPSRYGVAYRQVVTTGRDGVSGQGHGFLTAPESEQTDDRYARPPEKGYTRRIYAADKHLCRR